MLKYKLNIKNKRKDVIEVKYDSLFLSEDGSEITGITEPSYGLNEIETITVVSNETLVCSLSAYDALCCGYVMYNKKYQIKDFGDTIGILYNDGQYYCVDKNYSPKYKGQETRILSEYDDVLINPFITINNVEYEIGVWETNGDTTTINWKNEIVIPTKYWAYDEKITIDGVTYDVIIDTKTQMVNTDDYYPYIVLNDLSLPDTERILYVIDWEYSKRKKKTLFRIFNINQQVLHINQIDCVKQSEYFDKTDEEGKTHRVYADFYDEKSDFFAAMFNEGKQLASEWKKVKKSNVIDVYVNENVNEIPLNARVYVTPINGNEIILVGEENSAKTIVFEYYGREYINTSAETREFLQIEGEEYEIYEFTTKKIVGGREETVIKPYIIFNNIPLPLTMNSQKTQAKIDNKFNDKGDVFFNVVKYRYLNIENQFYKIIKKENTDTYYCKIQNLQPFPLQIINRFGSNVIRCLPCDGVNLSELFESMHNSIDGFICEVKTPIFDLNLIAPLSEDTKGYVASNISLFITHNSLVVPIKLEKDVAINLHKDYITHNKFFESETNGLINRIVDMEKDVYYPAYAEQKGNELVMTLCHQIQIDLHFRSRDLTTQEWAVNDENNIQQEITHPTNWNIFDYYRYSNDNTLYKEFYPVLSLNGDNQYYPPSDLLYFLKFTNEDVFYQKQKIGKSFLRLSFYNSKDPKTQSLLYTTTIFMSETALFQKYINSDKVSSEYVTVKDRGYNKESLDENGNIVTTYNVNEKNVVNHIGVDTEPCESNKKHTLTFNEEKRLSSSFIIKNRSEAVDSCEGFYLYLFKEYSNGLHESTIYMKVQFNHAGLGKTVNFMQMYHQNGNKKSMLNWSSKYNFDKYKEGCPLNELYDHIYIEIKIKYDTKNKRFCYYLPQWMSEKNSDKHTMRLSLFEVKIKDESK